MTTCGCNVAMQGTRREKIEICTIGDFDETTRRNRSSFRPASTMVPGRARRSRKLGCSRSPWHPRRPFRRSRASAPLRAMVGGVLELDMRCSRGRARPNAEWRERIKRLPSPTLALPAVGTPQTGGVSSYGGIPGFHSPEMAVPTLPTGSGGGARMSAAPVPTSRMRSGGKPSRFHQPPPSA